MDVQQNPFEKHRIGIAAECYTEALVLEGLPQDMTDELQLPDQPVNQQGSSAFVIHNLSDKPYRSAAVASYPEEPLSDSLKSNSFLCSSDVPQHVSACHAMCHDC